MGHYYPMPQYYTTSLSSRVGQIEIGTPPQQFEVAFDTYVEAHCATKKEVLAYRLIHTLTAGQQTPGCARQYANPQRAYPSGSMTLRHCQLASDKQANSTSSTSVV